MKCVFMYQITSGLSEFRDLGFHVTFLDLYKLAVGEILVNATDT